MTAEPSPIDRTAAAWPNLTRMPVQAGLTTVDLDDAGPRSFMLQPPSGGPVFGFRSVLQDSARSGIAAMQKFISLCPASAELMCLTPA